MTADLLAALTPDDPTLPPDDSYHRALLRRVARGHVERRAWPASAFRDAVTADVCVAWDRTVNLTPIAPLVVLGDETYGTGDELTAGRYAVTPWVLTPAGQVAYAAMGGERRG